MSRSSLCHWRAQAAPVIASVLRELEGRPLADKRAALRAAYPFGPRRYWPYRVWCDEVRRQLGLVRRRRQRDAAEREANEKQGRLL